MASELYLNTPLAQAVLKFFNRAEEDLFKIQLPPGSIKAYLFGGCAMHILTNSRGSGDIDVEFSAARHVKDSDLKFNVSPIVYSVQKEKFWLYYDETFSPTLGPLHENYQDDAIQIETRMRPSPLWFYVVSPADLAVSKLGRFGDRDIEDILTLIKLKKLSIDDFLDRASEAAEYYVGSESTIKSYINYIQRQAEQFIKC